jgi:hypothetical protein
LQDVVVDLEMKSHIEINNRFRIFIDYVASGASGHLELPASEFFDWEEFSEDEWACDLPWQFLTLPEYLPPEAGEFRELNTRIIDTRTAQDRTIYLRNLNGVQLSLDWDNRTKYPGRVFIILDVPKNKEGTECEVAKMSVDEQDIRLISHDYITNDSIASLL